MHGKFNGCAIPLGQVLYETQLRAVFVLSGKKIEDVLQGENIAGTENGCHPGAYAFQELHPHGKWILGKGLLVHE